MIWFVHGLDLFSWVQTGLVLVKIMVYGVFFVWSAFAIKILPKERVFALMLLSLSSYLQFGFCSLVLSVVGSSFSDNKINAY